MVSLRSTFASFDHVFGDASPVIAQLIGELRQCERIVDKLCLWLRWSNYKYCRAPADCEINSSIGLIPDPALHR